MPLRKKYKILKKVKEHHKKKAKEAKKQEQGKKGKIVEKDPGIPSAWPFREQELAALEARRQKALEAVELKKQEKKERQVKRRAGLLEDTEDNGPTEGSSLGKLAKEAKKREAEFEQRKRQKTDPSTSKRPNDGSKRAFYREFQKVIEAADVVIQVLDARDPVGCRCKEVERMVLKSGTHKRVVLLLNKIDLVPRDVVEKWLKYLRQELPTVAFKCSTQSQRTNLGVKSSSGASAAEALNSSQCLGAETLLQLLKNYSRNQKLKTSITVGVVGFPNVGKSSLINSLKRTRVANVGSTPGVTKAMQEIHLDKHVKLLDCPGIVFASGEGQSEAALRNAVKVETLEDPVAPVREILRLCETEKLMSLFKIGRFGDVDEFLRSVAFVRGKLKKGGIADSLAAARLVLKDWNEGKIPFYSLPPEKDVNAEHDSAAIVTEWGKDFDAEEVFKGEQTAVIEGLPVLPNSRFTQLPSSTPLTMDTEGMESEESGEEEEDEEDEEEEEDEEMSSDEENVRQDQSETMRKEKESEVRVRKKEKVSQTEKLYDAEGIFNPKLAKAEKKKKKKAAMEKSKQVEEEDDGSDYDFKTDFGKGEGSMEGVEGDDSDGEGGEAEKGGEDSIVHE